MDVDFMESKISGKIPAKSGNLHISLLICGFFPVKLYISSFFRLFWLFKRKISAYFYPLPLLFQNILTLV
ncbi:hypothetical protein ABE288_26810, partial [Bacillus salipaludis]|uniref:hypothetical protein n=1 Tax=Bacillus salipaludis TaxID=2547811 RepID=UPI003D21ADCE